MTRLRRGVVLVSITCLTACAGLPPLDGRAASVAQTDTAATRLGRAVATLRAGHPTETGVHALPAGPDSFAARVLLAAGSQRSLDVQYYIWQGDETGTMLFEALWQAAERGVRVCLLLDDNNTGGLDETLATLDAHALIEVRLFNLVVYRGFRLLNYATDFSRVNRRMHNKSFTADNQVSIVGGRNIGNEYFGAGSGVAFADLDVLTVGPAVQAVSASFDTYWNSASAYPARPLLGVALPGSESRLQSRFEQARAAPESVDFIDALRAEPFVADLLQGTLALRWAQATLVADDPAKTLAVEVDRDLLLLPDLLRAAGAPIREFDLVSPYLVLGEQGTAAVVATAQRGVKVRILTNSLASTDIGAVHAGYAKRRHELLAAGVTLYEIKPDVDAGASRGTDKVGSSSSASLHAKTFALDRERLFVGSFNFDPRSALLNTEMGLVIANPALARELATAFDRDVPKAAYEVRLQPDGRSLVWIERTAQGELRHDTEPGTSAWRRLGVSIMSVLPIDWLL